MNNRDFSKVKKYFVFLQAHPEELRKIEAEKEVEPVLEHARLNGFSIDERQLMDFIQLSAQKPASQTGSRLSEGALKHVAGGNKEVVNYIWDVGTVGLEPAVKRSITGGSGDLF